MESAPTKTEERVPRAVLVLEERARAPTGAPPEGLLAVVSGERGARWAHAVNAAIVNELPARVTALVDLRALDAPSDVAAALAHAKGSLWIAKDVRARGLQTYVVVTDVSHGSPVSAALHGLLKTASLEWPEVACCVLDVDSDDASALANELRCGFRDVEVVRNGTGRFVPVVVERVVSATSSHFAGVIVASGGARGVTATTLHALAKATRCSLLLLGRTPLVEEPACCHGIADEAGLKRALIDDAKRAGRAVQIPAIGDAAKQVLAVREIAAFLGDIEATGARAMYRSVDVRSVDEVSRACADARAAFGPITGIVHGAGVLADKRIEDKTAAQVDKVMDTKVLGLHALIEATRKDPVKLVALFSSVAGRFGNVGQVDYAMANEALNEMALRLARANGDVLVKSFNWGPWEGGMVTPALKKMFAERGVRVLAHDDGARHFVDELGCNDGNVEVIFGGELAPTEVKEANATVPAARTVHVSSQTHAAYGDHAIGGVVVLPAAGALEIIARATGATSFTDVRVLRGIKLTQFAHGGDALEVKGASLYLPGAIAPSYSALPAPRAVAPALVSPGRVDDASARFDISRVYDELLFHGPAFHVVDAIELMTHDGCVARVRGAAAKGWGQGLALDVGALDAALQLALLWARHETGGAFLPTSIARVDALGGCASGALRAVLRGRSCDAQKAVVDVTMEDSAGHVVLACTGIAVHRLADDRAFAGARGNRETLVPMATPGARA